MELKTKVTAEEGRLDLHIEREFDLPLALLFRAYTEQDLVEKWMSHEQGQMRYTKFDCRTQGGYVFENRNLKGELAFVASGAFHLVEPSLKIVRTFEIANSPAGVQLEILHFQSLAERKSQLNIHTLYESAHGRDMILRFGFAKGLAMAHDRLQHEIGSLT